MKARKLKMKGTYKAQKAKMKGNEGLQEILC